MRVLIVCGVVVPETLSLVAELAPRFDVRIGADRGAVTLLDAGIVPDRMVGDGDSLRTVDIEALQDNGVVLDLYPSDKDFSDLDLAVFAARDCGATELTVVGATGGRLDHTLATIGSLSGAVDLWPELADPGLRGWFLNPEERMTVALRGVGRRVSVQALTDSARVSGTGLRWPLADLALKRLGSHGISNEVESEPATVEAHEGTVLVTSCEDDSAIHTFA